MDLDKKFCVRNETRSPVVIDKVWDVNAMTITFLNGIFVVDMQERCRHYISICNVCGSADWWPVHSL